MNRRVFGRARKHLFAAISVLALAHVSDTVAAKHLKLSCDDVQRRVHRHSPADLRQVWVELGVKPEMYALDEWQNPTNEFAERAGLQVRRESGPLRGSRAEYVILVISDAQSGSNQYLFFMRTPGSCQYVGHVEAWDKYKEPQYRLIPRVASGMWFVLRQYGGSGTGFYREGERWHAVGNNNVRFVLGYPFRGYENPAGDAPTIFEF